MQCVVHPLVPVSIPGATLLRFTVLFSSVERVEIICTFLILIAHVLKLGLLNYCCDATPFLNKLNVHTSIFRGDEKPYIAVHLKDLQFLKVALVTLKPHLI